MNTGIRNIVIPGARMHMIVVMKLTPPRMVPRPDSTRAMMNMSAPTPGEYTELVSGAYIYQPNEAAPPGAIRLDTMISPENRKR